MRRTLLRTATLAATFVTSAVAQSYAGPQPVSLPPPVAAPQDVPYPGELSLSVDATDTTHRLIKVHESIPVHPGKLVLLYPEWIPGDHAGVGPIQKVAGLTLTAKNKKIAWRRDGVNMFAFHVQIPDGIHLLTIDFDYLSAVGPNAGRVEFTSNMLDLSWNTVLLYPAGYFSRRIEIAPSLRLPAGWHFASSLETSSQDGDEVHFQVSPLNTLVDSPVVAGPIFKRVDLSPKNSARVSLDIFADDPKYLDIAPSQLEAHKRLVAEAQELFGAHHYAHYDFLLMLSNSIGGQGLEHHQSSEDATEADYFTHWSAQTPKNDLLAHEFVHSWNGKYRRPNDLWTANLNTPMQNDLLWIYEGLTQYWGYLLAARSGLRSQEDTRDLLASLAAGMQANRGREWRTIEDTGNQPILSAHGGAPWPSWSRQSDYYMEGVLIWLDVDMKIRELSHDTKSLDNFAKLFYGMHSGSTTTVTYAFDDIVKALNHVQPFQWERFLHTRVDEVQDHIPADGFARGGYQLIYNDTMPPWMATAKPAYIPGQNVAALGFTGNGSFMTSLGFSIAPDATITRVWWDSPAFTAGLLPGMKLTEINGEPYILDSLREAIEKAKTDPQPIRLLLTSGTESVEVKLDYHEGLRYPHLERIDSSPDRLTLSLSKSSH